MKQFLRHNFNVPLAIMLMITAIIFITAGIVTGERTKAEAAEVGQTETADKLTKGADSSDISLSDADEKFQITEQIRTLEKKITSTFIKTVTYLKNGGKMDVSSVEKVLKYLAVPGVAMPAVLIFAFLRKR